MYPFCHLLDGNEVKILKILQNVFQNIRRHWGLCGISIRWRSAFSFKWLSDILDWWHWQLRQDPCNNKSTDTHTHTQGHTPPLTVETSCPCQCLNLDVRCNFRGLSTSKTEMPHLHDSSIREIFTKTHTHTFESRLCPLFFRSELVEKREDLLSVCNCMGVRVMAYVTLRLHCVLKCHHVFGIA